MYERPRAVRDRVRGARSRDPADQPRARGRVRRARDRRPAISRSTWSPAVRRRGGPPPTSACCSRTRPAATARSAGSSRPPRPRTSWSTTTPPMPQRTSRSRSTSMPSNARATPQCSAAGTPACFEGQCVGCVTSFDCPQPPRRPCAARTTPVASGSMRARATRSTSRATTARPARPRSSSTTSARARSPARSARTHAPRPTSSPSRSPRSARPGTSSSPGSAAATSISRSTMPPARSSGMSFWEQPERIRLTYLPLGRYLRPGPRVRGDRQRDGAGLHPHRPARRSAPACHGARGLRHRRTATRSSAATASPARASRSRAAARSSRAGRATAESDCGPASQCPSFFFVADGDTRADLCARHARATTGAPRSGPTSCARPTSRATSASRSAPRDDQCPTVAVLAPRQRALDAAHVRPPDAVAACRSVLERSHMASERTASILVVEDDEAMRDLLSEELADAGFDVQAAGSAAAGLEVARAQPVRSGRSPTCGCRRWTASI